jgi:hypothetical protein
VEEKVEVAVTSELMETTRTEVSTVITERQIVNLPVNGREFINFALLSPAVTIGDTTSGNTDVIVEPVTKLSFAGQNIHYNFIAVDGADDISTASGIQRGTPPQESVQEFRVINTDYSAEFGRATAGIVNIITRSGTNDWHGTLYEYFRNDKMDAVNLLQATGAHALRQNQFGGAIGGPLQKDKTFIYGNYEVQRRGESPFYNSAVLANIHAINEVKAIYGLAPEPNLGSVLRTNDTDNGFARIDHRFSDNENLFVRYFVNDGRWLRPAVRVQGQFLPRPVPCGHRRVGDQSKTGERAAHAVCAPLVRFPDGFHAAAPGTVQYVHRRRESWQPGFLPRVALRGRRQCHAQLRPPHRQFRRQLQFRGHYGILSAVLSI